MMKFYFLGFLCLIFPFIGCLRLAENQYEMFSVKSIGLFPIPDVGYVNSIEFLDKKKGFVYGSYNEIYKTINTGISWKKLITPELCRIEDLKQIDKMTILVGCKGDIYLSMDTGESWDRICDSLSGKSDTYYEVLYRNNVIYLIGDKLITSRNHNEHWIIDTVVKGLNTGVFINDSILYYGKDRCMYSLNINSGISHKVYKGWVKNLSKINNHFFSSNGNQLFYSRDDGLNWTRIGELGEGYFGEHPNHIPAVKKMNDSTYYTVYHNFLYQINEKLEIKKCKLGECNFIDLQVMDNNTIYANSSDGKFVVINLL